MMEDFGPLVALGGIIAVIEFVDRWFSYRAARARRKLLGLEAVRQQEAES